VQPAADPAPRLRGDVDGGHGRRGGGRIRVARQRRDPRHLGRAGHQLPWLPVLVAVALAALTWTVSVLAAPHRTG
jgi:hypothetical protein